MTCRRLLSVRGGVGCCFSCPLPWGWATELLWEVGAGLVASFVLPPPGVATFPAPDFAAREAPSRPAPLAPAADPGVALTAAAPAWIGCAPAESAPAGCRAWVACEEPPSPGRPTWIRPPRSAAPTPIAATTARRRRAFERRRGAERFGRSATERGGEAAARGAVAAAEQAVQKTGRGHRRQRRERGEVVLATFDFLAEAAAARAAAQMGADVAAAGDATVAVGERLGHRLAAHLPSLIHLPQAEPRLVEGLAGDRGRGAEGGADLGEVETRQLAHDQGPALALGQLVEVGDQPPQPFPRGRVVGEARPRRRQLGVELARIATAPQQLDRLVVGDPVEPGLQLDLSVPRPGSARSTLTIVFCSASWASWESPTIARQ